MRMLICITLLQGILLYIPAKTASAQPFDPRNPLGVLISAFQNCGPPQAYAVLAPPLFQAVYHQTSGRGCYPQIAQAGPVVNMQVVHTQQFPIGPLFVVRVAHHSVAADWYIGFNQFTGQVIHLNYQPAMISAPPPPPPIDQPPPNPDGPTPGSTPGPSGGEASDGCRLYPAMCAQ